MSSILTDIQLEFLNKTFIQSKNDKVIENMSKFKGFLPLNEDNNYHELEDSDLITDVWEVTKNSSETKEFSCVCGRNIKHQFLLKHRYKEIVISLGEKHYKDYCGISIKQINKIVKEGIVYKGILEEIESLIKHKEYDKQKYLLEVDELPKKIRQQLELKIPLIKRQLNRVLNNQNINNVYRGINELSVDELIKLDELSSKERDALIINLKDGRSLHDFEEIKNLDFSDIKDRERPLNNKQDMDYYIHKSTTNQEFQNTELENNGNEELIVIEEMANKKMGIDILKSIFYKAKQRNKTLNTLVMNKRWLWVYNTYKKERFEFIECSFDSVLLEKRLETLLYCPKWVLDMEYIRDKNKILEIDGLLHKYSKEYPEIYILDLPNRILYIGQINRLDNLEVFLSK